MRRVPKKRCFQKPEPSKSKDAKKEERKFVSSLNWIGRMYGSKLVKRIVSLVPKLGLFLKIDRFPKGRIVISMFGRTHDFHISIEQDSIIVESLKLGKSISTRDVLRMQHEIGQIGRKEIARESIKKIPLPETTEKQYPFERGNSISIGNALHFAIEETLDALEKGTKE